MGILFTLYLSFLDFYCLIVDHLFVVTYALPDIFATIKGKAEETKAQGAAEARGGKQKTLNKARRGFAKRKEKDLVGR